MLIANAGRRSRVISDRFGSIGLFRFETKGVAFFSTEFQNTVSALSLVKRPELDPSTLVEFLWFRRLFGTRTYFKDISWLPPSTIVDLSISSSTAEKKYWHPKAAQLGRTRADWVDSLVDCAGQAGRLAFLPKGRHGLMLSGGLDSRCLLALGRDRYKTFCNAPRKNAETQIAESLASIAGSEHHYIQRPVDYLDKIFNSAVRHSNGMTQYYECQFLGYEENLRALLGYLFLRPLYAKAPS